MSLKESNEVMTKILENAEQLVEEASLLLDNNRFARAYTLAHLACEETAKIPMVTNAVCSSILNDDMDWKKFYNRMRSHNEKITGFMVTNTFFNIDIDEGIRDIIENYENVDFSNVKNLNNLKNNSIYAGFINNKFYKPSEIITEDIATKQVKTAFNLLKFHKENLDQIQNNLKAIKEDSKFREFFKRVNDEKQMEFIEKRIKKQDK